MNDSTFLSAFNARTMTFEQVAETFCPSNKFAELAGDWNALLLGPRGSGKTTLLKMLSLQGMRAWPTSRVGSRPGVNYTGIFIPADVAWREMVNALASTIQNPVHRDMVVEVAFVTNTLLSVTRTIDLRTSSTVSPDAFDQVKLLGEGYEAWIRHVAQLWHLTLTSLSIKGLTSALELRLVHLRQEVEFLRRNEGTISEGQLRERIPYLGLPIIESVSSALSSFNHAVDQADHKWALLFDEFEIAPSALQNTVIAALRGAPPDLLIKVGLVPCGPHATIQGAPETKGTQRNDFRSVLLWYTERKEALQFCTEVCTGWLKIQEPSFAERPLKQIFGAASTAVVQDAEEEEPGEAQADRTRHLQAQSRTFLELCQKDSTFSEFLTDRGIDPYNLIESDADYRRATVRKIAPIVAFRNAYRSSVQEGQKRGRRPYSAAYIGWEAIAAMSEGNPRWLIGLLISMWANGKKEGSIQTPIQPRIQTTATLETGGTFVQLLRSLATVPTDGEGTGISVLDIVEDVANYFFERLVTDDFVEDPPSIFEVDDKVPGEIEDSLRLALNHGAIICFDPPDNSGGYPSLRGRQFRLAYLLAQQFKLPIRKSKHVSLSTILNDPKVVAKRRGRSAFANPGRGESLLPKRFKANPISNSSQGAFTFDD